MPSPRLQRAATARREKVQLPIREQNFFSWLTHDVVPGKVSSETSNNLVHAEKTAITPPVSA
jgi:hypothetical protein